MLEYLGAVGASTVVRLQMGPFTQRRLQLALILVSLFMGAYATGFGAYEFTGRFLPPGRRGIGQSELFWEAWNHIEEHFYGAVPSARDRTYGAVRASLGLLDAHTVLVEPTGRAGVLNEPQGPYQGIGVSLWRDREGRIFLDPSAQSAAERAGVRRGDVLLAVDREPVTGKTTVADVEQRLQGELGSEVVLSVSRSPTGTVKLTVVRLEMAVPSVTWRMATPDVGYMRLERVAKTTSREVADALVELERAGASALVLDLRDTTGALLESAVEVAAQFLHRRDVVLHQMDSGVERTFRAKTRGDVSLSLAVLVNGGTARGAEVVAAALQDHGRAALIGEVSSGEGSVQEVYELSDGSSLRITAAMWLTPRRRRIDENGLMPDVVVSDDAAPGDEQLDRAVRYLESGS